MLADIMLPPFRIPSITGYNRLEAAPRTQDLNQSLSAQVRDPLWMLTRQWQFGEFQAEDAGSPIQATILGEHTPVDRVSLGGGGAQAYDPNIPLENLVTRETIQASLFMAVQIARYYVKLMTSKSLTAYLTNLQSGYPLKYTIDPNDQDGLQLNASVSATLFDGWAMLQAAQTTQFSTWLQTQTTITAADQATLVTLAGSLIAWFNRTFSLPATGSGSPAWQPSQLEYQFEVASPAGANQRVLSASQYDGGPLDWYSFDLAVGETLPLKPEPANPPPVVENVVSFIPSPVSFKGMPLPRYWMMEDSQIDFGKIDTSPTGLLSLLVAEFGLVYGNDWFMLPYPLSVNTLCEIKGIVVKDVFGEYVLVKPVGLGTDDNWQQWALFHQSDVNQTGPVNYLFYLAPAAQGTIESNPLEQVNFLRDEAAEMVWAVEDTVPSQAGMGVSGNLIALNDQPPPVFVPAGDAAIQYVLGTTVPDNWIPFIPVHIQGSNSQIRFQRAAMPGAKGALGRVLTEVPAPYYIDQEQIPRDGVIVQRAFHRTRWLNGKTFLWMSRFKETGTGEGWSNLKFDQIVGIPGQ
ncbi:hypothetical protein [Dinghuibacter silviterrae]|uniref:Uncharacterized protein n=1 Tax=Dinghuibacter silviterrae TaxID=1539049 RepID=A0A4R8DJX6_9BACT|nr:hypothetical protein [Dinghuibacter silviterrae]TDW97486.1 hypothetical protein EDB95_5336 [Dinghuibacter silviterrae]